MSSVKVSFPSVLRAKIGNHASVLAVGETVRDIINALEPEFPGLIRAPLIIKYRKAK